MCTLLMALDARPDLSLLVLSNRDEAHARPTEPMHAWPDPHGLIAGRDGERGGLWLGVDHRGRLAALTNVREGLAAPDPRAPSRGRLGLEFLGSPRGLHHSLDRLAECAGDYPGFNLLLGTARAVYWVSNRLPGLASGPSICRRLSPGLHGLSNGTLDEPWPKVRHGLRALQDLLARPGLPGETDLLDLLLDDRPAPDGELPDTGVGLDHERRLSPLFIRGESYGTRASTLLLRFPDGRWSCTERRWGPGGRFEGESRFGFDEIRDETL